VGLGAYNREFAREVRAAAEIYGVTPLITDDYLAVERAVAELQPELVLGTQMERHISKRLKIACAVISAPSHVQDYPARYSPQLGFEGANVLFDTWVHPLAMGLEEHLLSSTTPRARRTWAMAHPRPRRRRRPRPSKLSLRRSAGPMRPRPNWRRFPSSFAARPAGTLSNSPSSAASP
jgi:light-independent protochlorophyllide reductase B subunit